MDERLSRIKTLIGEIEEKETELNGLMGGATLKARAAQKCSKCGSSEHNARNCTHGASESTSETRSIGRSTTVGASMSESKSAT